jgi:dCMP deaminase
MEGEDREKTIQRDRYFMALADAVQTGAACRGSKVGAVIVLKDRVVSTGYNGTPAGFLNCEEDGCVRCRDRWLEKEGRKDEMSDPDHTAGKSLDRCICVHAEQNAFMTAARFGIALDGATLYSTQSPCFGCLKEAVQAGITRIVYARWYRAHYNEPLREQYFALAKHLTRGDPTGFEVVGGGQPSDETDEGQPDAYSEDSETVAPLEPPGLSE